MGIFTLLPFNEKGLPGGLLVLTGANLRPSREPKPPEVKEEDTQCRNPSNYRHQGRTIRSSKKD